MLTTQCFLKQYLSSCIGNYRIATSITLKVCEMCRYMHEIRLFVALSKQVLEYNYRNQHLLLPIDSVACRYFTYNTKHSWGILI